jgi:pyruvate,water dikinase
LAGEKMANDHPEPKAIPIPDNFQFEWSDPEDAKLPLLQDKQHVPNPMTPLAGWLAEKYWSRAAGNGFGALKQPISMVIRRINTYYYNAIVPIVPPEQMDEAGQVAEEALKAVMPRFVERWDKEWEPEIAGYHETWNSFDLSGASDEDLLKHLQWTLDTYVRIWHIHFEALLPAFVSISMFVDVYADLMEDAGPLDAYKLLQGVDNNSLRADQDLWAVSKIASATPELESTFLETPTADVMAKLAGSGEGRKLRDAINSYLDKWGKRSDTVVEIGDPSWIEDPSIAIDNLKAYVRSDSGDPIERWKELVGERERLVEEVQEHIAGYPDPVKQQFNGLLVAGQQGQRLQEDHNWWIDQQGTHQVRQVFLEFGDRLVASEVIAGRDDVMMLTGDEVLESAKSGFTGDFRTTVVERRAEMERWQNVEAPLVLGTDYGPPPDNPVTRAIGRFFVFGTPPQPGDEDQKDLLRGVSGSSGKASGIARVIIKLSDAGRLSPGEILVTTTTSPPWTPLFATAGGIVTDTGGALSHCAIVAREYGLPATVGTGHATKAINDGQRIEVDGDAGTVRLL